MLHVVTNPRTMSRYMLKSWSARARSVNFVSKWIIYKNILQINSLVTKLHSVVHYRPLQLFVCFFWAQHSPQWARASSFTVFLDHTQRLTTVSRTPLDE